MVRDTGARYPIFNAPIGYFARSSLAGAVSAAGGMGLLEMNTMSDEELEREDGLVRARTSAPFGHHMFLRALKARDRLDHVLDWALGRATFIATCAGNPAAVTGAVRAAGLPHYHQVGSVEEAQKALDAGVTGLIVEGAEAGGLRSVRSLHLFSLLQQVRGVVGDDVPLVAAGGIVDGVGMAGAFALGADGVVMGTRFMSSVESPVHDNWKTAVAESPHTINIDPGMPNMRMRVIRNELSEAVDRGDVDPAGNPYGGPFMEAFANGRLDKAMVGCGESASLISSIESVESIVTSTVDGFWSVVDRMSALSAG